MLKNLNLSTKFNLLLLVIFITGVILSSWAFSTILERNAQTEVTSKALVLLETMNSIRNYTNTQVNPELAARLETEEQFLPQTVPAYSAREVFEHLRTKENYGDFFYKEATLNPTNLRDQADEFETKIVEQFRQKSELKQLTGFRSVPGGDLFYVARPLAITQESCLRCHSTPDAAPKSQIATYGSDNGFGWKLNEIVAAQIMSVPASDIATDARQSLSLVIAIVLGIFSAAILLINLLLKHTVIQPLKRISQLAKEVSTGNMAGEFEHQAKDEIGVLAASFNRMKSSLEVAMNMLNQNQGDD